MDAQSPDLGNGTLRSAWSVPTRSHTCTENWNAPGACPATLPCPAVPYPASGCQPASRLQSGLVSAQRCWKRILCQPQRTGPGHNKHTRVGLGRQSSGGIYPAPSTGRLPPLPLFLYAIYSFRRLSSLPSSFLHHLHRHNHPPSHPATPSFLSTERGICWGRKHPFGFFSLRPVYVNLFSHLLF